MKAKVISISEISKAQVNLVVEYYEDDGTTLLYNKNVSINDLEENPGLALQKIKDVIRNVGDLKDARDKSQISAQAAGILNQIVVV